MFKKFSLILILFLILGSFYKINLLNYGKIKEIQHHVIAHPENLPTHKSAIRTSFGFKNIKADLYWIQTVQYIGSNAVSSEYKKYLFVLLDLITELNPFFEHPYIIGELLLPSSNERYETDNFIKENHKNFTKQALILGLKGVDNFCDPVKLGKIKKEYNLKKIWTDQKYINPCVSYKIPFHLAFIYFHYLHQPEIASYYYKVASANEDSPEGSKIMSAIMQGKGGDREKAFFMFINMASQVEESDQVCNIFSKKLSLLILNNGLQDDVQTIQKIESTYLSLFGKSGGKSKNNINLQSTTCLNYVQKAIRELNLSYIQKANQQYKKDTGKNALDANVLLQKKYISFLPTDPQNEGEEYDIIYNYNEKLGHFDYDRDKY